jgi:hypothetical protein
VSGNPVTHQINERLDIARTGMLVVDDEVGMLCRHCSTTVAFSLKASRFDQSGSMVTWRVTKN